MQDNYFEQRFLDIFSVIHKIMRCMPPKTIPIFFGCLVKLDILSFFSQKVHSYLMISFSSTSLIFQNNHSWRLLIFMSRFFIYMFFLTLLLSKGVGKFKYIVYQMISNFFFFDQCKFFMIPSFSLLSKVISLLMIDDFTDFFSVQHR